MRQLRKEKQRGEEKGLVEEKRELKKKMGHNGRI